MAKRSESARERIGGRGLQAEKMASAKVLRWEQTWGVRERKASERACSTVSKWESGWDEVREQEAAKSSELVGRGKGFGFYSKYNGKPSREVMSFDLQFQKINLIFRLTLRGQTWKQGCTTRKLVMQEPRVGCGWTEPHAVTSFSELLWRINDIM